MRADCGALALWEVSRCEGHGARYPIRPTVTRQTARARADHAGGRPRRRTASSPRRRLVNGGTTHDSDGPAATITSMCVRSVRDAG